MIVLHLRAKHFKGADFIEDCPVEAAANEQFGVDAHECVDLITICHHEGMKDYKHDHYGLTKFGKDLTLAESCNYDDTIIRQIDLYEA